MHVYVHPPPPFDPAHRWPQVMQHTQGGMATDQLASSAAGMMALTCTHWIYDVVELTTELA